MKQIYTQTGDQGETSLRGGTRVPKDDLRIEVNGQIDHLNALLGLARASLPDDSAHRKLISNIQTELMTVMSHVATPDDKVNPRPLHCEELIKCMERTIDNAKRATGFVLPGKTQLSALFHVARTQTRTAERRLWSLSRIHAVNERILILMNRLSDYLFVVANEMERLP